MTMLASMRRHSLRMQHHLHRWSICATEGSHLVTETLSRSRSCSRFSGSGVESLSSSSEDSVISEGESAGASCPFTVVMIGENGVGKSALACIFAGAADSMGSDCELYGDEVCEQPLMVDGESATISLMDTWDPQDEGSWTQDRCLQAGDAYIIVYSITDRSSFLRASELRIELRRRRQADNLPIILVGNKCDLVRRREVSVNEGRACAVMFDCKFIETSAAMQHNVWPLFQGVVRQLRLHRDGAGVGARRRGLSKWRESIPKKAKRFIDNLVARNSTHAAFRLKSKSCHNLSVL